MQEYLTDDGFYSIDIALFVRGGTRIAIEVDGPSHFAVNDTEHVLGDTVARRRALVACGWVVISVPVYVWRKLNTRADQAAWLQRMLVGAMRGGRSAEAGGDIDAKRQPSPQQRSPQQRSGRGAAAAGQPGAGRRRRDVSEKEKQRGGGAGQRRSSSAEHRRSRSSGRRRANSAPGTSAGGRLGAVRRRSQEDVVLQRPVWRWGQYTGPSDAGSGSD